MSSPISPDEMDLLIARCVSAFLASIGLEAATTPGPETILFGTGGCLDSMGLVTVVIDVEQKIQSTHGVRVVLADDRAMSQRSSPFRTIASLRDYALKLLGDSAANA